MENAAQRRRRFYFSRKEREDLKEFASLIASPASMGSGSTALTLPGRGKLAISHSVLVAAGAIRVNVLGRGGHTFSHGALAANQKTLGKWAEKGQKVTITDLAAGAGTTKLYVIDTFGRYYHIASATLT